MDHRNRRPRHGAAIPGLEVVDRLEAARVVLDAMLGGRWLADPETILATGDLLRAAGRWAQVNQAVAA